MAIPDARDGFALDCVHHHPVCDSPKYQRLRRESPRFRGLWRAEVVLETDCSEQLRPEWAKVSSGDFRDNSLSERCDENFLFLPQERQVMLAGERLHRDAGRLFTVADSAHEPGREEGQAEQPGHLRFVDTLDLCDFSE